jgi:hypothetical protein
MLKLISLSAAHFFGFRSPFAARRAAFLGEHQFVVGGVYDAE